MIWSGCPILQRTALGLVFTALAAACAHAPVDAARPVAQQAAPDIDPDAAHHWRDVDTENLLIIELPWGKVLVELAPQFAPLHVAQMRRLVRAGHYDQDASFYRVIDGFVTQGGVLQDEASEDEDAPVLPAEFERPLAGLVYVPGDSPDLYAPQTGHVDGFAVGHDPKTGLIWPLHCYGSVAMARSTGPDTGTSHFYVVNGRDQRYLDRNLTVFGRVLAGMAHLQQVTRGDAAVGGGVIAVPEQRSPIVGMTIAADLPAHERPRLQVMKPDSPAFAAAKARKFYRDSAFFQIKPRVVEACAVLGEVRAAPAAEGREEE